MPFEYLKFVFPALCFLVISAGCAFFAQEQLEPTRKVKGDAVMGEKVGYHFDLEEKADQDHRYLLTKSPYCTEQIEELTVFRDRRKHIGGAAAVVAAPFIIAFPRVGGALIMTGLDKSREEKVLKTGIITTGKVIPCGAAEPAPGETVFIQSADMKIKQHLQTDAEGILDLSAIVQEGGGALYFNLYIDNGDSVFFITTIFIR